MYWKVNTGGVKIWIHRFQDVIDTMDGGGIVGAAFLDPVRPLILEITICCYEHKITMERENCYDWVA